MGVIISARHRERSGEAGGSLVISNLKGSIVCCIIIFSPRWLWFDLFLNTRILPNQRGFFNFFDIIISFNSGIGVLKPYDLRSCIVIN